MPNSLRSIVRPRRNWLLPLLLLLLRGPLAAQTTPSRRYWEANPDSLRQVLDTQHTDTARLHTLMHMFDIGGFRSEADFEEHSQEMIQLLHRLRRPEADAFRQLKNASQLAKAHFAPAQLLDTAQAVVEAFDRVGHSQTIALSGVASLFKQLNQPEAQIAYFQAKLAQYQAKGDQVSVADCHHLLGGPFVRLGDYNQGISHYLRAADLFRAFNRYRQENELRVVGSFYADWGNPAKALYFMRQAMAVYAALPPRYGSARAGYTYRGITQAYRQLHNYPAALRAANQALVRNPADTTREYADAMPLNQAYGLALKSAVLLDMGRVADAGPLLARAQQLSDSAKLALTSSSGFFELDATWARYYTARNEPARAEAAWLAAYRKARELRLVPQRLAYLRGLADFYARRGQEVPAGRYARLGLALADSLRAAQGRFQVAGYEAERAEQAQQARIGALRLSQQQDAARARRQRYVLGATLVLLALLAGLGFVLWRGNRRQQRANALLSQQKAEIQAQRDHTNQALAELRTTQAQLIQKEKMASLGELTAGIAHEIQNPLNFVNNFAEVSAELMGELEEAQAAGDAEEMAALANDVSQNLGKISHHGRRAAAIVKGMLEHSRTSTGERAPADLNSLADEYLRLAYQGLRAKDKSFNCALKTDLVPGLPRVLAAGADVGRVLLNLFGNAFYAVQKRQQTGEAGYTPTVSVSTKQVGNRVEIRVRDNGTGMPESVQAKIFQPFFTTKPTGEGTGLGLSLSHDIIAQGHGGTLSVESQPGNFTEFLISLPLN